MRGFKTLIKTEIKLLFRNVDTLFFGVLFPVGLVLVVGAIWGGKPSHSGSEFTFLENNFGAFVAIGICATGLMGLPLCISDYRHKKILKRYKVTPVSPAVLLFVQIVVNIIVAVLSAVLIYLVSTSLFHYKMTGSIIKFILVFFLVLISIYSLGMAIASFSPNIKVANMLCVLLYFPMLFLSGATLPYEKMPIIMQKIVNVLPLTQGIKLLKASALGVDTGNILLPLSVMIGLIVLCIPLSIRYFKWE
ncbi:ABC transporter permease [Oceanirhabdus sp. W0125-5]|nr:ABC transporter permease [Oceanirhabdus sp. W0125-5]WBW97198.1 ABC transporter permease [Oceanirhabdus sp. W0125-5]